MGLSLNINNFVGKKAERFFSVIYLLHSLYI